MAPIGTLYATPTQHKGKVVRQHHLFILYCLISILIYCLLALWLFAVLYDDNDATIRFEVLPPSLALKSHFLPLSLV